MTTSPAYNNTMTINREVLALMIENAVDVNCYKNQELKFVHGMMFYTYYNYSFSKNLHFTGIDTDNIIYHGDYTCTKTYHGQRADNYVIGKYGNLLELDITVRYSKKFSYTIGGNAVETLKLEEHPTPYTCLVCRNPYGAPQLFTEDTDTLLKIFDELGVLQELQDKPVSFEDFEPIKYEETLIHSTYTLPDIKFTGLKLVKHILPGTGMDFTVYKTVTGKFICVKNQLRYAWPESNFSSGCSVHYAVVDDIAGIIAFFGHSMEAEVLYDILGVTDDPSQKNHPIIYIE